MKPKGLAKLWREIKRPFKKSALLAQRIGLGLSVDDYNGHFCRHQNWRKYVFIDEQQKVHLPHVEYYLINGCNLKCEHCVHFNPFRSGIAPYEELVSSFEGWSNRLCPEEVRLLGGEPLLHPQFEEITMTAQRIWGEDCRIVVITNGLLLPKLEDRVLRLFAERGIAISISQHLNTEEYNQLVTQQRLRLEQLRVSYKIDLSFLNWYKTFNPIGEGGAHPCSSNPKTSWVRCTAKECTAIIADRLYRCSWLANATAALNEKAIDPEWNRVLSYVPMTLKDSPNNILKHLHSGPMGECMVCPEVHEPVVARQLTIEQIQRVRNAA